MHGLVGWLWEACRCADGVRADERAEKDAQQHDWDEVGDEVLEWWEGREDVHHRLMVCFCASYSMCLRCVSSGLGWKADVHWEEEYYVFGDLVV